MLKVTDIILESYNKLVALGYRVKMRKYKVWMVYEAGKKHAIIIRYYVVNRVTHTAQSSWKTLIEARAIADRLNASDRS